MIERRTSRGRRRADYVDGATRPRWVRVVGWCAIILTLTLSTVVLGLVYRRAVTIDALNTYGKRQECFNQLVADYSVALTDAAATTEGTDARRAARDRFIMAGNRLRDQRAICIEPFPLPES